MSTAESHQSRGISWDEGDRTSEFPKHPSKADYLKSAHDPHCKSRPEREDRKKFIAMFQGSFLESFVHLQRRWVLQWVVRIECSPFPGALLQAAGMHWFIFAASTATGFLNLHDRRVSLWSHWKPLSAPTSSKDSQVVSLSSPTCCLSRAGIFILVTEMCQVPSVAAHTLLALSKAHLAQLDLQGNRNSSLVQLQELLILPPLFSSFRPAKTWPRSDLWKTWSSHNQQETLDPKPESKEIKELGGLHLKISWVTEGWEKEKKVNGNCSPAVQGRSWDHLAQHPMTAIPDAQWSLASTSQPLGMLSKATPFPLIWEPMNRRSWAPHTVPEVPTDKKVLVVCSCSSPVPISTAQCYTCYAHCVFFFPLSLQELHSQSMEYQTPGRKVGNINFDLSFFLAYETKPSLLEGAGIWDTASVGQHDWKAHSSLSQWLL